MTSGDDEESTPTFVELEQLCETGNGHFEWREKSRWIKLEEDIEDGSERWCKPFVPILSFQSILELKYLLATGNVVFDIDCTDLICVAKVLCRCLQASGIVQNEFDSIFYEVLLARHHHQHQNGLVERENELTKLRHSKKLLDGSSVLIAVPEDKHWGQHQSPLSKYMNEKSEATTILLAQVEYAVKPAVIFLRLLNKTCFSNLNEVDTPVRYFYLVIGPRDVQYNLLNVSRTIGTLMSDIRFGNLASLAQCKEDLLCGIEEFVCKAAVLPNGKWEHNMLIQSVHQWYTHRPQSHSFLSVTRRETATLSTENSDVLKDALKKEISGDDSLKRTGKLFGGLKMDLKRKLGFYLSDFTDAWNLKCLSTVIVIYFSFLAPAITFAALLSNETKGLLGVSEMIMSTALSGIVFGFFSGQPLVILGATGPLLIMETSIYQLSESAGIQFLPWRVYIGFWVTLFSLIIVAFDLSFLITYFTLFTEEIVAALTSTVFIYYSLRHVVLMLEQHYYPAKYQEKKFRILTNVSESRNEVCYEKPTTHEAVAFMTIILLLGTFMLCYYLRKVRYSQYFSIRTRRLLSDFGILTSILFFVSFDMLMEDDFTPKLEIADPFSTTSPSKREWFIDIMKKNNRLQVSEIFFAAVPAFPLTVILFMETQVTGVIINRKEHKLLKGAGYNLDILIVGVLTTVCSLFGLPWMCACPVHSMSHLHSLSILSTNNAPGTKAQVTKVIEQRVTNIAMHLIIGLSIFIAPVLRYIPISVLFGVFLYLGVTSLSRLQMTQRIQLMFIPPKLHPDISYIRKVKTKKIYLFTAIQVSGFLLVLIVENSILAPCFPFVVILMIPLRNIVLMRLFTYDEMESLDGHNTDDRFDDEDDEVDAHATF